MWFSNPCLAFEGFANHGLCRLLQSTTNTMTLRPFVPANGPFLLLSSVSAALVVALAFVARVPFFVANN